MATTKDSAPAHPSTRTTRGISLYREHGDEITRILPFVYEVPSCSGETTYIVHLAPRERCECADFERRAEPCKHIIACTIKRAKSRARVSA